MTSTSSLFDRIAPMYDALNDGLSLGQHRIWKKMVRLWANPQPGEWWLDLCCGSGDMAMLLAPCLLPGGRVTGIDFAPAQLEQARQKSQGLRGVDWQEGDVTALPFEDQEIDGITMTYGLRNLNSIDRGLQEMYRLLKPKKRAVILDLHRPYNDLSAKFQQWYLSQIVVPVAALWHLRQEYAYLWESLQRFPQGGEQVRRAYQAGFRKATHYPIVGGMMGILVLEK